MKKELYEALCSDFTAIFQCDLIKDTLEIIKYDTGLIRMQPSKNWILKLYPNIQK